MKKHLVFAAMAAALTVSCAREQVVPSTFNEDGITKITVAVQDTKLTIGELNDGKRPVLWDQGDQIAVNGVVSDELTEDNIADGGASATFVFQNTLSAPLELVYPASAYKEAALVELNNNPSYSKPEVLLLGKSASVSDAVTLKSAVSLIKTTFAKGDGNDAIRTISVSSPTAQLRGLFTPDYENGTLTSTQDGEEFKAITQTVNKTIGGDNPLEIYTIVPAGTYDVTVKVTDVGGNYMEKKLIGKTFETGNVYALPETKFEPTGKDDVIEIPDANAWNDFATAFNANPEEYTKPVEITGDLDFFGGEYVSLGTDAVAFPLAINGNDHVVSNIANGNAPLINNLGETGILKNLTIDESCNYVDAPATDSTILYFAPFVKELAGTVENCENKASIVFNNYPEEFVGAEKNSVNIYIAGIAAYLNSTENVRIINCRNSGNITIQNSFNDDINRSISSCRFAVGGIAGYGTANEIRDCKNSGDITCNYPINGYVAAGISGAVVADYFNCTNGGSISKSNGNSNKGRIEHFAGINAYNWATDSKYYDCSNTGNITSEGYLKVTYIGGITAYNTKPVDLQRCSNSGVLKVLNQKINYENTFIGGLLGYIKYAQTIDLSGCSSTGELALTFDGSSTKTGDDQVAIGGIVGLCGEGVTINGNGFAITPNIHVTFSESATKTPNTDNPDIDYFGIGAIVGVNREVNGGTKGKVVINNCKVDRGVVQIDNFFKVDNTTTAEFRYNNLAVGGILGVSLVGGAEIKGCDIYKAVIGISPSGANAYGTNAPANMAVGGIAGRVRGGTSSISDCSFKASNLWANVNHRANETMEALTAGCIIGECVDAENTMAISNCTVELNKCGVNMAMAGGIAGKASNTTITDCSVDLGTATFANARSSAGIVGMITNGTVSGCKALATAAKAIYGGFGKVSHEFAGGFAAIANNTVFTNCKSFANVWVNKAPDANNLRNDGCAIGGFVAKAVNGCTFTDCSFGGTLTDNGGKVITPDAAAKTVITLDASNVNTYAIQVNDGDAPTFTYWNGE